MSILWFGGEDIDFMNGLAVLVSTTSAHRRTSAPVCSRCAIGCNTAYPGISKSSLLPGGGITAGWLSFQLYGNYHSAGVARFAVGFGASGTNSGIFIGFDSAGAVVIGKYNGTTFTVLGTGSGGVGVASLHRYDLQMISYGATGQLILYLDQARTADINYSGDISISGVASFDSIYLASPNGPGAAYDCLASEIIVADEDTRSMYMMTHYPNAAGDTNDWTGAYTAIDETTFDDSDSVYVDIAAKDCMVNVLNTPAGTFAVKAVMISARAGRSTDSTPTQLSVGIKSGGTVDVDTAADPGNGVWLPRNRLMQVNPVTGNPVTTAELDALQIVLRSAT